MERTDFYNSTFFLFPIKVGDRERLLNYLQADDRWSPAPGLQTNYMLCYAEEMNGDGRLQRWTVAEPSRLPLYLFDARIAERMKDLALPSSGETAKLDEISLYLFGSGVAFLEFRVRYQGMSLAEIEEFIFCFRSLQNDETKEWLRFSAGQIGAETAINRLLPAEQSGTQLCFSNLSSLKRQAIVYSVINPKLCKAQPQMDAERCRHLIVHGYKTDYNSVPLTESRYEMRVSFREGEYWGGCQDGLACFVEDPHKFQFDHLCGDYHFLYLLLLNQRYSLISYVAAFSRGEMDQARAQEMHRCAVELKLRYSFRIISDDAYMQTIYNQLYDVLEIDPLLKDLDESGEQMNELLQREQARRDSRFGTMLAALSVLAVFSALVDLSDYLEKFGAGEISWSTWVGLIVNLVIIGIGLTLFFKRKK